MKRIKIIKVSFLVAALLLVGCQKESLRVVDLEQEESITADAQLFGLVRGVTAHDGSHDDIVDKSSCFSINFPFSCNVNGEIFLYEQASDLNDIYETDVVEPVYPITVTYADYIEVNVDNSEEFQELINRCASGSLYNEAIECIDLIYPISISMYNTETSDFETRTFDHDKITFTELTAMTTTDVASVNYPIFIQVVRGDILQIDSNQDLKTAIQSNLTFCY